MLWFEAIRCRYLTIQKNTACQMRGALLCCFCLLCSPTSVEARGPMLDATLAQVQEQAATLLRSGKAAEAYSLYMTLLREDPENPEINLGLAQAATAIGEHNQAVLALERLVDAYPQDAGLRMELARALFRGDNIEAAQRELQFAKSMNPNLSDEITEKVLARLEKEAQRWQLSGRVSGGVVYDSNVNMGPQSAFMTLGLWPLRLDSSATRKQSWGAYAMASLDGGWRTSPDSPWWVVGDVALYRKSYFEDLPSNKDLSWGRGALGLRHIGTSTLLDLRVKSDQAEYIGDDQAAYSTGPELLFAWGLAPNVQLLTRAAWERRDYRSTTGREGWYFWAGEYLRILFGQRGHDVTFGGRWLYADTKTRDYGYQGWEASLQTTFKLPYSFELSPFLLYRQEYYNGPATALELKNRQDDNLRVGLGLSWFLTPAVSLDTTYQYTKNTSASPLYTYTQDVVSIGLTWRF